MYNVLESHKMENLMVGSESPLQMVHPQDQEGQVPFIEKYHHCYLQQFTALGRHLAYSCQDHLLHVFVQCKYFTAAHQKMSSSEESLTDGCIDVAWLMMSLIDFAMITHHHSSLSARSNSTANVIELKGHHSKESLILCHLS